MINLLLRLLDVPSALVCGGILIMFFNAVSASALRALDMFGIERVESADAGGNGAFFAILELFGFRDVVPENPHFLRIYLWFCMLAFIGITLIRLAASVDASSRLMMSGLKINDVDVAAYISHKEQQKKRQ